MSEPIELVPGLWRWTRRHPEWHPGEFGAEVGSYAVVADDALLLIDPLVDEGDPADALIDDLVRASAAATAGAVAVLITVGYHVRSAERLCDRHGASLHGPNSAASRLEDPSRLHVFEPNIAGPGGAVPFAFGTPARSERPLWLPSHRAVVFGDMIVTNGDGDLVLWESRVHPSDERRAFYRDTFVPTFAPLLGRPIDHVLTTHGAPIIGDGHAALERTLAAEPWFFID